MGNRDTTPGWARNSRQARISGWRAGFANAQLMIALAILAAVGLLLQLQTCDSFPQAGGAAKKAAAKRPSKAPALIPPVPQAQALARATDEFIDQRSGEIARIDRIHRESIQAYARMDGRRAAQILTELDPTIAVEILAQLKERDIARILEEAAPADAAAWTTALLLRPEFAPVPDALQDAAARAGLYDNLPDLMQQAGIPQPETEVAGAAANTENTTAGADASGGAASPEPGAADGTAAPATAPETANPAGQPPPDNGDATAVPPAADSLA